MKKYFILGQLIILTLIGNAQKLQLTEAATEFRNNYNSSWNNDYRYNGLQGPYWLPEGTTLQAGTNVQYISVIEFNIQ